MFPQVARIFIQTSQQRKLSHYSHVEFQFPKSNNSTNIQ